MTVEEYGKKGQTGQSVGQVGTWRFRYFLHKAAVVMALLGIATAVGAATSGFWFGLGAAACWITLGVLSYRQYRRLLSDKREVPAAHRARWALAGTALFFLGVAFIVIGKLLVP